MSNSKLIVHCGGHHVGLDNVYDVRTPSATATHHPIPHAHLYELARKHITQAGYQVVAEQHALHTINDKFTKQPVEGANWFALIELEGNEDGYGLVIGLRNSHAQAFSASIAIGSRVFVCDNLAFSGEVQIARKHTRYIFRDLPQVVGAAVGQINAQRVAQAERISAYQQKQLSVAEADHLFVELLRARSIASSDIWPALQEFDKPKHLEHLGANGEHTVWTAVNAVTEAVTKGSNVFALSKKTQALHGVCDSFAGVQVGRRPLLRERLAEVEDAEYREAA